MSARSLPLTLAVVLATTACAPRCFAAPAPLMRLEQVTALSNAEAAQHLPVEITGTVTYVRPSDSSLFLRTCPETSEGTLEGICGESLGG